MISVGRDVGALPRSGLSRHRARIEEWSSFCRVEVAVGGEVAPSAGYFITPTVIDRPAEKSRIVVEEPFGTYRCPPF